MKAFGGHVDGGGTDLAILSLGFVGLCALISFFLTARWARKRFAEFEA